VSEHLTDPLRWAQAFNMVPDGWKFAATCLLGLFVVALIQKWRPRNAGQK